MFELEHRQAAPQLTPRATACDSRLGAGFAAGRRRVRRPRAGPRRDDQRRLAVDRRGLYLCRRLPVLFEFPREPRLWSRSPPRHTRRAVQQRPRFRANESLGPVRSSFRRHCRSGAAGGAGTGGPVRFPARDAVARHRRGAGGSRPGVAAALRDGGASVAGMMIAYGFMASVLPVWMLLCPRDYLSTFLKITTVVLLGVAILIILPPLRMPALTPFATAGEGPVFAGKLFPFAFITIACGAISGFHSLVASGTTPKMITRATDARLIGYGGMIMESFVGIMAMIAACTLDPGVYFAMNTTPAALAGASDVLNQAGFVVTPQYMQALAAQMGEQTLIARTGGAPSLAVGIAHIFSGLTSAIGAKTLSALWYHFAIMFEALFILTTIDTGTRVGRFMLQEIVGHAWPKFAGTSWVPSVVISSAAVCAAWGYFLWQGVVDPYGGINALWPLFGIANQLLAAVALCVATTILIKMGKQRYAWVTLGPLAWLITVTMTAGTQLVFSSDPKLGFFARAAALAGSGDPSAGQRIANFYLDAGITLFFMAVVAMLVFTSAREWWLVLSGRKPAAVHEAPYVETALIATGPAGS